MRRDRDVDVFDTAAADPVALRSVMDGPGPLLSAADRDEMQATVLRLSPAMHAALKERAAAEERTMAQVMRRALRAYLDTEVE